MLRKRVGKKNRIVNCVIPLKIKLKKEGSSTKGKGSEKGMGTTGCLSTSKKGIIPR